MRGFCLELSSVLRALAAAAAQAFFPTVAADQGASECRRFPLSGAASPAATEASSDGMGKKATLRYIESPGTNSLPCSQLSPAAHTVDRLFAVPPRSPAMQLNLYRHTRRHPGIISLLEQTTTLRHVLL